jgi:nicotinamidase-related amidase
MASTLFEVLGAPLQPPTSLENSALIVIDIQNEYLPTGKVPLHNVEQAIDNAANVISLARKHKVPVVHIVHHTSPGAAVFDPQGNGSKIVPKVAPIEGEETVVKHFANSFVQTNLQEILAKKGIKQLFVVGFMTHNCISSTVRAAAEQYGYSVVVIANATGTRALKKYTNAKDEVSAENVHDTHLAALADMYAYVTDSIDDIKLFK